MKRIKGLRHQALIDETSEIIATWIYLNTEAPTPTDPEARRGMKAIEQRLLDRVHEMNGERAEVKRTSPVEHHFTHVIDPDSHDRSWYMTWLLPKSFEPTLYVEDRIEAAVEAVSGFDNVDPDRTPLKSYSPTGEYFHSALWGYVRPSGRVCVQQNGGFDC